MTVTMTRKTMRRTRQQAKTLASRLREYGATDVKVARVSQTDWAVTWRWSVTYREKPRED